MVCCYWGTSSPTSLPLLLLLANNVIVIAQPLSTAVIRDAGRASCTLESAAGVKMHPIGRRVLESTYSFRVRLQLSSPPTAVESAYSRSSPPTAFESAYSFRVRLQLSSPPTAVESAYSYGHP
ncbi:hypothetical protein EDC01DRAFT_630559 [Geopyxis carbonaria]|nr:hypothetical protein EDC01DRAFT_630559 [Geopyxis carbonaria]